MEARAWAALMGCFAEARSHTSHSAGGAVGLGESCVQREVAFEWLG